MFIVPAPKGQCFVWSAHFCLSLIKPRACCGVLERWPCTRERNERSQRIMIKDLIGRRGSEDEQHEGHGEREEVRELPYADRW